MIDAPGLVERLVRGWKSGVSPFTASVLDVLLGDLVEEERGTRPEGAIVEIANGTARVEPVALSAWTFGWPTDPGPVAKAAWATGLWPVKWIDRRVRELAAEGDARQSGYERMRADLGAIPWTDIADMEVVSLAMGHFGPARQPAALPVIEGALFARSVAFAAGWYYERVGGMARDRLHAISERAEEALRYYDDPFHAIQATTEQALAELARRTAARNTTISDPSSLPVRAFVKLLG